MLILYGCLIGPEYECNQVGMADDIAAADDY